MKKRSLLTILVFIFLLNINLSFAEVGVGISPTKIILQVEGGKTQEIDLMVFNSGDDSLEVSLKAEGNLDSITEVEPKNIVLEPEPKPHKLPIKNGKIFVVKFNPPATRESKKYTGTISAIGSPTSNSQFGGSVGVATRIELIVTPTKSVLDMITRKQVILASIIVLLIIIIFLLKKAGFQLKLERKK